MYKDVEYFTCNLTILLYDAVNRHTLFMPDKDSQSGYLTISNLSNVCGALVLNNAITGVMLLQELQEATSVCDCLEQQPRTHCIVPTKLRSAMNDIRSLSWRNRCDWNLGNICKQTGNGV